MTAGHKRKISNFFLKKDFQGKIILAVFLSGMGGSLSIILLLALFTGDTLSISYDQHTLQLGQTPLLLFKNVLIANWVFLVIGGTFLVFAAIIGTHRIAGPLFRFEKALAKMKKGDLSDIIVLRNKDEGKQLAGDINSFNSLLSDNLSQIQNNSRSIEDLIIQFQASNSPSLTLEEVQSICNAVHTKNKKIQETLSVYTLKDD